MTKRHQKAQQAQHRLLRPGEGQNGKEAEDRRGREEEEEAQTSGEEILPCPDILPEARGRHRSLQRTPRKPVPAGAERLLTHPARLAKSSATAELGA